MADARSAQGQNPQQKGSSNPADGARTAATAEAIRRGWRSTAVPNLLAHVRLSCAVKINVMKGAIMKSVIRYRSQPRIIFRGNYKPNRVIRIRAAHRVALIVRPARAGPQINTYEYATD